MNSTTVFKADHSKFTSYKFFPFNHVVLVHGPIVKRRHELGVNAICQLKRDLGHLLDALQNHDLLASLFQTVSIYTSGIQTTICM